MDLTFGETGFNQAHGMKWTIICLLLEARRTTLTLQWSILHNGSRQYATRRKPNRFVCTWKKTQVQIGRRTMPEIHLPEDGWKIGCLSKKPTQKFLSSSWIQDIQEWFARWPQHCTIHFNQFYTLPSSASWPNLWYIAPCLNVYLAHLQPIPLHTYGEHLYVHIRKDTKRRNKSTFYWATLEALHMKSRIAQHRSKFEYY